MAELRDKLEQKKAMLAEISLDNESMLKKQEESKSLSRTISREQFEVLVTQAREKYKEFEDKIKKAELKLLGSNSTEYEVNVDSLFESFVSKNYDNAQMFDFIRSEYLRLIMDRKNFVQEGKERIRKEKQEKKE